jgi:chorismate mutase / prephenate dehydratase
MQKLLQFRKEIDRLDDRIVGLLNRRMKLVENVGNLKALNGNRVYDRSREKQILARLCSDKKNLLKERDLRLIYKKILAVSRQHQRKCFKK